MTEHTGPFERSSPSEPHAQTARPPLFTLSLLCSRSPPGVVIGLLPSGSCLHFPPIFEFSTDQRHVRDGLAARPILAWLEYRHSHPPRCAPRLALPDGDHPLVPGSLWTSIISTILCTGVKEDSTTFPHVLVVADSSRLSFLFFSNLASLTRPTWALILFPPE